MKKFLSVPIALLFYFFITSNIIVYADDSNASNVIYEKLENTETANEFNSYREELLSFINEQINRASIARGYILPQFKSSQFDFNDTSKICGYKVYEKSNDYKAYIAYDDVIDDLSNCSYSWNILIMSDTTAANIVISPYADRNDILLSLDDNWCVTHCNVSKSKKGNLRDTSSDISAVCENNLFIYADENINRFIQKNADIKVIFVHFGKSDSIYNDYMTGGIVFVDSKAKYIYSFGLNLRSDGLNSQAPDGVKKVIARSSDKMYFNKTDSDLEIGTIKGLFDYTTVINVINIYEKYC